ncbi:protein TRACHEARY ELEMENT DIFFERENTIATION-RELATED 7A-like [Penaeus chinensis]|uniref:protein TRACHEARY ELEMENT DIFFERENTIATION-RELATED 7A-like n=1 Tax=Penaeus chinensis TaxID=139456 RepID=UPI001FB7620D|nr:protein TRACHEARY ELEMENT DIFFERENTIATION-RELATED 7A-like [Penaeus chinensis]
MTTVIEDAQCSLENIYTTLEGLYVLFAACPTLSAETGTSAREAPANQHSRTSHPIRPRVLASNSLRSHRPSSIRPTTHRPPTRTIVPPCRRAPTHVPPAGKATISITPPPVTVSPAPPTMHAHKLLARAPPPSFKSTAPYHQHHHAPVTNRTSHHPRSPPPSTILPPSTWPPPSHHHHAPPDHHAPSLLVCTRPPPPPAQPDHTKPAATQRTPTTVTAPSQPRWTSQQTPVGPVPDQDHPRSSDRSPIPPPMRPRCSTPAASHTPPPRHSIMVQYGDIAKRSAISYCTK